MNFRNFELRDIKIDKETVNKAKQIVFYLFVFLLALFSAKILDLTIESYLIGELSKAKPLRYLSKSYKKKTKVNDSLKKYTEIIKQNIFNADTELPKQEFDQNTENTGNMKKTSLNIELIGTIVLNDPHRSVAAIKTKKEIEPFSVDDIIDDTAKIVSITNKRVVFNILSTGKLEYLAMEEDQASDKLKKGGIRKIDDEHIIMDKGELNRNLNNLNQLLLQARAVPYMEDGEVAGFKLLGIKRNSLYDKLGAKNGDIIKSVNGIAIDSPTVAMKLYHQLRTGKEFNIEIDRKGEIKDINIQIR